MEIKKSRRVGKKRNSIKTTILERNIPEQNQINQGSYVIYGLRDPRTDEYKYVGKSSSGISRPKAHLVCSHNSDVNKWINDLESIGKAPYIDIFESCDINVLDEKERYWIAKCLESECKLFNVNLLNSVEVINKSILDSKDRIQSEKEYIELQNCIKTIDNLGFIIKNKRFSCGLTQEELSLKAGIHRTVIVDIEKGKTSSISSIKKIINALNEF